MLPFVPAKIALLYKCLWRGIMPLVVTRLDDEEYWGLVPFKL
jgi:hypothetical protein